MTLKIGTQEVFPEREQVGMSRGAGVRWGSGGGGADKAPRGERVCCATWVNGRREKVGRALGKPEPASRGLAGQFPL